MRFANEQEFDPLLPSNWYKFIYQAKGLLTTSKVCDPSYFIPSHPIPSHPIPSHPIPSHPIPSHTIPYHTNTVAGGEGAFAPLPEQQQQQQQWQRQCSRGFIGCVPQHWSGPCQAGMHPHSPPHLPSTYHLHALTLMQKN